MTNYKNNKEKITFESMPEVIGDVLIRLKHIEELLANKNPETALKPPITTKELCAFLDVTEPTILRYRKKNIIPYFRIGSAIRYDLPKVILALEKKKRS